MILDRETLKSRFPGDVINTGNDFADLIDSVLVKRDDHYFGQWSKGISFSEGDMVIYDDSLYVFLSVAQAKELHPDCDCEGEDDNCCNNNTPDQCCRWMPVHLDMDDQDWTKYDEHTMYARVFGRVGIGTGNNPQAFLHLKDAAYSAQFLFDPAGKEATELPMLKLVKGLDTSDETSAVQREEDCDPATMPQVFVSQKIETLSGENTTDYRTTFQTDTLGYLFKKTAPPIAVEKGESPVPEELTLMFVTSSPERPRVGIGTDTPEATLDVTDAGRGKILVNPGERKDPEIILLNLDPSYAQNYLTLRVGARRALLLSDAPNGFAFRKGIDYPRYCEGLGHEAEQDQMVIDGEGRVGIGVSDPQTRLEVSDERQSGSFRFQLDLSHNPSLNILNFRPLNYPSSNKPQSPNYLALGTDDRRAVISTDSKEGLTFKKGKDFTQHSDHISIGRGKDILALRTDDEEEPGRFSALVNGYLRAQGVFIEPIPDNIDIKEEEIPDAVGLLKNLLPKAYQDNGMKRMGFFVENTRQSLPGSCKVFPDNNEAIGYHDLVVLLVKAVQELSTEVNLLKKQLRIKD